MHNDQRYEMFGIASYVCIYREQKLMRGRMFENHFTPNILYRMLYAGVIIHFTSTLLPVTIALLLLAFGLLPPTFALLLLAFALLPVTITLLRLVFTLLLVTIGLLLVTIKLLQPSFILSLIVNIALLC